MLPQPIVDALSKASNDKLLKVLIIDANGNVVSGNLTNLANALQSVGTDKLLVVLSEDDVGIAKDTTLSKLVNALQSVGTDKLLAVLSEDDVGVAKDATLNKIVNALQSVGTDKLLIDISQDDVGLAKDTTVQGLYSKHIQDIPVSLSNTGTAAVWDSVLATPITIAEDGEYGIVIALDTATTVKLDITIGTVTHSYLLNDGNSLTANAWYEFAIHLAENDHINFEINVPAGGSVNGIIRVFKR